MIVMHDSDTAFLLKAHLKKICGIMSEKYEIIVYVLVWQKLQKFLGRAGKIDSPSLINF